MRLEPKLALRNYIQPICLFVCSKPASNSRMITYGKPYINGKGTLRGPQYE